MTDQQEQEVASTEENNPVLGLFFQMVSLVFHPLFVATYSFLFVRWFFPYQFAHLQPVSQMQVLISLMINTIVFPGITLFIMQRLDFVDSLHMRTRHERIIPLIGMALFYFWSYMVVKQMGVGGYFTKVMLGGSLAVFGAFFFNNFFKISLHAVGAGVFLGVALSLTLISSYNLIGPLMIVILIAGLIGSARLYSGSHNQMEIATGYAVGLTGQLIAQAYF